MDSKELNHNFLLPNLFVPGAGKSGTSTLHELLNQHPKICMSSIKEPQFWTKKSFESFSAKEFEDYASLFEWNDSYKYFGESSTSYMCFPEFIERINSYELVDCKFIFILRNPIDRCYSHYWWLKGMGSETNDLKSAFLNDLETEPSNKSRLPIGNFKNYYQFGLYAKWLRNFYNNFDKKRIHFITHESLKKAPLKTINSCFDFLEISKLETIEEVNLNKTTILSSPRAFYWSKKFAFKKYNIPRQIQQYIPYRFSRFIRDLPRNLIYKYSKKTYRYPKINIDQRSFLKEYYIDDVKKLKSLVNYDFPEWHDFKNIN